MPVAKRYGKGVWPATLSGGETAPDTRALDYLIDCGWVDTNDGNTTPTTLPGIDRGGELIIDRGLTYGALVTAPNTVWVDESNIPYSDHRALGGRIVISDEFPRPRGGRVMGVPVAVDELNALIAQLGKRGYMWHHFRVDRHGPRGARGCVSVERLRG